MNRTSTPRSQMVRDGSATGLSATDALICRYMLGIAVGAQGCEHTDLPHPLGLLRARRERPRGRRAAQERDKCAPVHSITSSARSRNDSGIDRPSTLAVVRLMMRSNLVGCSTGMSAGFAPRRILST